MTDKYDERAQQWVNGEADQTWLIRSRAYVDLFRAWAVNASLEQLESWWARPQTQERLKKLKHHHKITIETEILSLIEMYRNKDLLDEDVSSVSLKVPKSK